MPSCDFRAMGLTVRAFDCPPRAGRVLRRLLGADRPHQGFADVRVRFVEKIDWSSARRFAGTDTFWDGRYLGIRQPGGWLGVPFGDPNEHSFKLICERGVRGLPILRSILQVQAVRKGYLPVHGSAFAYKGRGFIATGWPRAAKTGMALAAMNGGGALIAAEQASIDPESLLLHNATEPIQARPWHVRHLESDRHVVGSATRTRLLLVDRLLQLAARFGAERGPLARLYAATARRNFAEVSAERLTYASPTTPLTAIICVIGTSGVPESVARSPLGLAEERLILLFESEIAQLSSHYRQYQFLVPGEGRSLIDDARTRYQLVVSRVLQQVPCYEVLHAKVPAFPDLLRVIDAIADRRPGADEAAGVPGPR